MLKKVFSIAVIIISISSLSFAQTITIKKENARIKGENIEGLAVDLEGNVADINSSFVKYLKTVGKIKQSSDYIVLSESILNGKTYTTPLYALAKEKERGSQAWLGIKISDWAEQGENINKPLEKILYDFGVQFYRDKVQVQIDESNRALQAVERQQQRFTNQNRDLNMSLEDNKREKVQLEKSIENNKTENEMLLKKIDKNKLDRDSLQIANDQIMRVIEMQKERQSKIY